MSNMGFDNEKLARWLEDLYAKDYFRFDQLSSPITVSSFKQDNNKLSVEYEFWDDGHANKGAPEYFLFDVAAGDEYGVNFPSVMQLIKIEGNFSWPTKNDCDLLNENLIEEIEKVKEVIVYKWGDPEIDKFIEHYLEQDKENLIDMLINYYDARNGLPEFVPQKLKPYFEKLILSPEI